MYQLGTYTTYELKYVMTSDDILITVKLSTYGYNTVTDDSRYG